MNNLPSFLEATIELAWNERLEGCLGVRQYKKWIRINGWNLSTILVTVTFLIETLEMKISRISRLGIDRGWTKFCLAVFIDVN